MICARLPHFCPKLTTLRFLLPYRLAYSFMDTIMDEFHDVKAAIGTLTTNEELWVRGSEEHEPWCWEEDVVGPSSRSHVPESSSCAAAACDCEDERS